MIEPLTGLDMISPLVGSRGNIDGRFGRRTYGLIRADIERDRKQSHAARNDGYLGRFADVPNRSRIHGTTIEATPSASVTRPTIFTG